MRSDASRDRFAGPVGGAITKVWAGNFSSFGAGFTVATIG
jgi:hypothetical protein